MLTWSGGWICAKPWIRWDPCTLVREGWRECSLKLVMIKHTRLECCTISSTTSFRPAATNRREESASKPAIIIITYMKIQDDLLCAMCCCSSASGPFSCSGEASAPLIWSKSSRRTTEGCLHSASEKASCSICLTVSALLPEKTQFLY